MAYKHGTYQTEVASDINLPVMLDYGHFIVGTAPVHKVKKDKRKINELVRLANYREAVEYFGDTYDLDFSISQAIKVFFELYAVGPLYVVNIFDPAKHKTSKKTEQGLEVKGGKVLVKNHKIMTDTLVVKENTTSQPIADALTIWTEEGLEIHAKPSTGTKIDIEYEEADLSAVTKTEAIGGYNTNTMKRTGLELINDIFLKFSELPAFIDVPDFSHESDVAAVMATKATNINGGMFESMALINAPIGKRYDEIPEWKDSKNILDKDQLILYGMIGLSEKRYYQSLHYAALSMSVDNENDGIPSQSPSNYKYKMDSLLYKTSSGNFEEIILDRETQANFLNKNGVITAISFKGWRNWGTETAKNPLATDPKDKFSYSRRLFKYIGNELVISYFDRVDKKFSLKLAETVTKAMNIRLNSLVSTENLLSASAELSVSDNDVINIINGDITWIIKLGIIPGLKSMTFKKKYDVDALTEFAKKLKGIGG